MAREFSEDKARQGMFSYFSFFYSIYYPFPIGVAMCWVSANSRGTGTGGSLGWKTRGSLDATFEKAAYDLEPSTTGNPKYVDVKTGFGYHIIMVEGRK